MSGRPAGQTVDSAGLRRIFEELIAQGARKHRPGDPYPIPATVLPALEPRLPVPVVYNCGGYERVETLKELEGKVDMYLPDLKYAAQHLGCHPSGAGDYFPVAAEAIREMVRDGGRSNGREKRWSGGPSFAI